MATQPEVLFYTPDELLTMGGYGTSKDYLAALRAEMAALTGSDAEQRFREVASRAMVWREAFDRPTYPENREVVRSFLDGMDELLREARARLGLVEAA